MRRLMLLLALPLVACGAPEPESAPIPASTSFARTPEDCSELAITALEVQPGVANLFGTHAELLPKGQFVRVRIAITNTGNRVHDTRSEDYQLVDTAAAGHRMSIDAMRVKRQLSDLEIGAGNRLELDLWYDLPVGAIPRELRDTVCASTIAFPGR
ncbi:hypothetical protein AB0H76_32040 [Nocardia sp. NPDC050712]|uniref:hypothetical protein n=1 Tax=Nocardia sp. NPDC050712 TaxID=3155518 RepID=UPI0033FEFF9D